MSAKAQNNEIVIAWEKKQSPEQGNIWERTKEMLCWERDGSPASTSQNLVKGMQMSEGMELWGDE